MSSTKDKIYVIIPAFNEEKSIDKVINDIPSVVEEIIVVNNNSTDQTVAVAESAGATVLTEHEQGYGAACLLGIDYVNKKADRNDIVVFIDGDYSDYPQELLPLIYPIQKENVDMVIGSRRLGDCEKGSLTPQQIFGNWLATTLIRWIYKFKYTDLGPFRAIRLSVLNQLEMKDRNYGWTVEMQIKAIKQQFSIIEIPVNYKKRIGISKVSGTIKGTVLAGYKIITTIIKYG